MLRQSLLKPAKPAETLLKNMEAGNNEAIQDNFVNMALQRRRIREGPLELRLLTSWPEYPAKHGHNRSCKGGSRILHP